MGWDVGYDEAFEVSITRHLEPKRKPHMPHPDIRYVEPPRDRPLWFGGGMYMYYTPTHWRPRGNE